MPDHYELLGQQFGPYVDITVTLTTGEKFQGSIEWMKDGFVNLRPKYGHGNYHTIRVDSIIAVTRYLG